MSLFTRIAPKNRRLHTLACDAPPLPQLMPDLAEYMTVTEAAQKLEISSWGVRRLIKIQKLEALLVGKMYLVSKKSVTEYHDLTKGMGKNDPTRGKPQKED